MARRESSPPEGAEQPSLPGMAYLPYLRAWRAYRGIGLLELGRRASVGRTTINEVEQGRRMATAATIGKLAKALKIKPTMLVFVNPEDLPEEETGAA